LVLIEGKVYKLLELFDTRGWTQKRCAGT